jgi:hypothetical protein
LVEDAYPVVRVGRGDELTAVGADGVQVTRSDEPADPGDCEVLGHLLPS